jgi:hypothetical protein
MSFAAGLFLPAPTLCPIFPIPHQIETICMFIELAAVLRRRLPEKQVAQISFAAYYKQNCTFPEFPAVSASLFDAFFSANPI